MVFFSGAPPLAVPPPTVLRILSEKFHLLSTRAVFKQGVRGTNPSPWIFHMIFGPPQVEKISENLGFTLNSMTHVSFTHPLLLGKNLVPPWLR
jgi:hypothetical protein